jgi:hypothetical protein
VFDHVTIRVADLDATAPFSDPAPATLGIDRTAAADWLVEWGEFSASPANAGKPVTERLHTAFPAPASSFSRVAGEPSRHIHLTSRSSTTTEPMRDEPQIGGRAPRCGQTTRRAAKVRTTMLPTLERA